MAFIEDPVTPSQKAKVDSAGRLYVVESPRTPTGVYLATSGQIAAGASADTAPAGKAWLVNPVTSTKDIAVRRIEFTSMAVAASAAVARIVVERISFTGAFTAGLVAAAKRATVDVDPVGEFRTANTGGVITTGNTAYGFLLENTITVAGGAVPVMLEYEPDEDGMLILDAGEGLAFRQAEAGDADVKFIVNIAWEEF